MDELSRRGFLRLAGGAASLPALAQLLAACGGNPEKQGAATATSLGANATKVKLGFIALTDHASIVMAWPFELRPMAMRRPRSPLPPTPVATDAGIE